MQKRKIQMIVYDGSRVGAFVSALLLALVFIGDLPPEDRKVNEMLKVQQQNTVALIQRQAETLTARSIALSEELTQELEQVLSTRGKTFEEINNDPELIFELETAAYSSVKAALNTNYCSGAFFIMDATVNTEIEKAETSRMGVYLRLSDLKAVSSYNQHIKYFRGMAEVARKDNVELHNRWNLEFDISNLPGYENVAGESGGRLSENCFWTERIKLQGTWEEVILVCVPVLDSHGMVRGICGLEMSDLYFSLSYPAVDSPYGNIVTAFAPVKEKKISLEKAMLGNSEGTFLKPEGELTIKEKEGYYIYASDKRKYIGNHQILKIYSASGSPFAVVSLLPETGVKKMEEERWKKWMLGSTACLVICLLVAFILSQYLKKEEKKRQLLLENELPENVEVLLRQFMERADTLTPMEQIVLCHYAEGMDIKEVAEYECISIGTARKHNTNMNRKLGTTTYEELMLYIDLFRRCGRIDQLLKREKVEK